jgi:hypothetical protein
MEHFLEDNDNCKSVIVSYFNSVRLKANPIYICGSLLISHDSFFYLFCYFELRNLNNSIIKIVTN